MRYVKSLSTAAGAACLAAALAGTGARPALADYGAGAQYQIEISASNAAGVPGDGVWLWIELNGNGSGDYTGSGRIHTGRPGSTAQSWRTTVGGSAQIPRQKGLSIYARIVTITRAKDIDGGIGWLREQLPPVLKDQKGFRGLGVNVDRAGGILGVLTLWDTEADWDASWDALATRREEGLAIIGGQLSTKTYEECCGKQAARRQHPARR